MNGHTGAEVITIESGRVGSPSLSALRALNADAAWQLPRGRGRRCTGRSSPWQASTGAGRMAAQLPGPPAGSGPYPHESTGDQINTEKRKGIIINNEHVTHRLCVLLRIWMAPRETAWFLRLFFVF